MHRMHRLILLFSVSALAAIQPASAQFEVAPDHFDNPRVAQTEQSARAEQNLRERIAEEQSLLDNYTATARGESAAGGEPPSGSDLCGHRRRWSGPVFSVVPKRTTGVAGLKRFARPLMDSSREVLAGLRNDLDMLEAGTTSLSADTHGRSKSLQASARPGR